MSHEDDDFSFEPVPGLPAELPRGEQMLWQGSPKWRSLAWRGLFVRPVAIYFAVLMTWRIYEGMSAGGSVIAAVAYALELVPFAAAAIGVLVVLAWGYARSTIYTITTRRIVVRSGIALPMTVNLPFNIIENAALRLSRDGTGDVPLKIAKSQQVYSLALWPNVRPWNFGRPEPMLRAIPAAERVANLLARALQASLAANEVSSPAKPPVRDGGIRRPAVAQSGSIYVSSNLQGAAS